MIKYNLIKRGDFYYKDDIIAACREVHGGNYDYSLLPETIKNKDAKIPIICYKKNILGEEHGVFEQSLARHLSGRNCPKCSMKNVKYSDEEIIAMAKAVHGDKYEYLGVIRENGSAPKIHAICHKKDENGVEHGEFMQTIAHHINGKQDCPKCRYIKSAASKRREIGDVIRLAREVHGDDYDYSFITEYKNDRINYSILCKKHNKIFYQSMNRHIKGRQGCPICGREKCDEARRYTTEEWIEKANEVHGDKYIYNQVEYENSDKKVKIFCKKCGKYFWQTPSNHLYGQGCPHCTISKLEDQIERFLKENNINFIPQMSFDWLVYKRGMTLDFYLPNYNIGIECQGKQHFGLGGWKDTEEEYKEIYDRDNLKRKLCEEHGIKLLYFSNLGIEYPYEVIEDENILLEHITKRNNRQKLI